LPENLAPVAVDRQKRANFACGCLAGLSGQGYSGSRTSRCKKISSDKGLPMRRNRQIKIRREMPQEGPNLVRPHLPRMPPAVKMDEAFYPVDISQLSPYAVVLETNHLANPPEQGWWLICIHDVISG
jgi:hypothetical protein